MSVTPIYPSEVYSLVTIKQRDSARLLFDDLSVNGTPLNLATASVALVWLNPATGTATRKTATIVTAASGSVSYQLTAADVETPGSYLLEWEVTFTDTNTQLTVPTDKYLKLNITDDLDS